MRFLDGREDISDGLLPGRPRFSDGVKSIQNAISEDKRRSIRDIADISGLSLGNVHAILTTQLEMNKVRARYVQLEFFISKRSERHEVSVALINRRRQNDVPECSVRLYKSSLYFNIFTVSMNSIFMIFLSVIGGVFIFHHV